MLPHDTPLLFEVKKWLTIVVLLVNIVVLLVTKSYFIVEDIESK
jgi:hypothetical protein